MKMYHDSKQITLKLNQISYVSSKNSQSCWRERAFHHTLDGSTTIKLFGENSHKNQPYSM